MTKINGNTLSGDPSLEILSLRAKLSHLSRRRHYGIMFNQDMTEAFLEGRKTVTRRTSGLDEINREPGLWKLTEFDGVKAKFVKKHGLLEPKHPETVTVTCKYGPKDTILYVKEGVYVHRGWENGVNDSVLKIGETVIYPEDKISPEFSTEQYQYHKPVFMPKKVARRWMSNDGPRIERLHDITEKDACDEGVKFIHGANTGKRTYYDYINQVYSRENARDSFRTLWKSLYGNQNWHSNVWVWVIPFTIITPFDLHHARKWYKA